MMVRKDPRSVSSVKRGRVDKGSPNSRQSPKQRNQVRTFSESSESSDSDAAILKNFSKPTSHRQTRKRAFCFAEDTSNSSDDIPLSKLVSCVQETNTISGDKQCSTNFKKGSMNSEEGSDDSSDVMPSPTPQTDEDSKLSDEQIQAEKRQVCHIDSDSTDGPFNKTEEKGNKKNKKRKRGVSSDEDNNEDSPPRPKFKKTEGSFKDSVTAKGKRTYKRVDSSSSSGDDIFPEKIGSKKDSKSISNSESDSSDDDYGKDKIQSKSGLMNCSGPFSEGDSSAKVKSKLGKKSSPLEKKIVVSSKSSTKAKNSSNTKRKTDNKENSTKSTSDEKRAMKNSKKAIGSSLCSSSDGGSDHDSSDSSSPEDEKPVIRKQEKRKKNRKRKKSQDLSSADKNESKEQVSPAEKKEDVARAKDDTPSSSSESSPDSDDDDKENVDQSSLVSKEEPEMKEAGTASSSDSSDSEEEDKTKKAKSSEDSKGATGKQSSHAKKKTPGDNPRIARLQKYLKAAGIRVQNYKTLWEGCKTDKARAAKLLELLEERGLKGKPTLSECKKLRKKLETEKEIAELNTANIIQTTGRPRRNAQSLYATPFKNAEELMPTPKKSPEFKKAFTRLKAIVDSEDSE